MKYFITALFSVAILFPTLIQADEGWKINSFDSQITVKADGKVQIKETVKADFGAIQKHGIFRDIPYEYRDDKGTTIDTDITNLTITNGTKDLPYSVLNTDTFLRIKIGDADRTVSGVQQYVISYVVTGVLRSFGSYDELYWNTTGNDWPVPINSATASVSLSEIVPPTQASCYEGLVGSTTPCSQNGFTHFTTARDLPTSAGLTIAVGFPSGKIPILSGTGSIPGKIVFDRSYVVETAGALLATLLVGIGIFAMKWRKNVRDDSSGPTFRQTVVPEYEPPAKLHPAEIGVLMDERADAIDLSATIIDLANRGFLTVKDIPKSGLFGKRDYEITKTDQTIETLLPYETKLLDALFSTGQIVKLSTLRSTTFSIALAGVKKELYQELTDKGLFVGNPDTIRTKYRLISTALLIIGFVGFASGISILNGYAAGITIGLFNIGLIGFILARAMPKRSTKGTELLRQAKGYKLFLTTVEKDRVPFFEKEGVFMQSMPYAMVFGVATQFAKRLSDLGANPPQPTWYVGTHPFVPLVFAADMNDFSTTLNSAFAPISSSSGSGGGGFSGGGFGGGGGGSW